MIPRFSNPKLPPTARQLAVLPLPANEEQEQIAERLERADVHGVVVQGPPGTGKTHTIANIIGHCMARGQRVLCRPIRRKRFRRSETSCRRNSATWRLRSRTATVRARDS